MVEMIYKIYFTNNVRESQWESLPVQYDVEDHQDGEEGVVCGYDEDDTNKS